MTPIEYTPKDREFRDAASELEYHLLLAHDLKLIQRNDYELLTQQTTEIKRMLTAFVQKLTAES